MRSIFAALVLLVCNAASSLADSPPGHSTMAADPIGATIARIEEVDFSAPKGSPNEKARISLYKFDPKENRYAYSRTIAHVGPTAPNLVLLTRNAEFVIAFDSSGQIGRGDRVVIVYNGEGKLLCQWSLEEILSKDDIKEVPKSTSSTWWRSDALVLDPLPMIVISGPKELAIGTVTHRYRYVLNLETLTWEKAL
jgi:hypothetical protein